MTSHISRSCSESCIEVDWPVLHWSISGGFLCGCGLIQASLHGQDNGPGQLNTKKSSAERNGQIVCFQLVIIFIWYIMLAMQERLW